jgi:hypothetical protein
MKCEICEKENYVIDTKKFPAKYCSYKCYEEWQKFNKSANCECAICKIKMYLKPSRLKRVKNDITCSLDCASKLKSQYMSNEGNHQFGLKGTLNSSFKGLEIENINHKNIDIMIYVPEHPKTDQSGRVLKHRYIVEQNYIMFNEKYFEILNNYVVLKDIYDIHHIDFNHNNNDILNLIPLTRNDHTTLHNKEKIILRDSLGRITGVLKQDELLENLEVDNQQPSLNSNVLEGSTTNSRIQTDNAEDSNVNTSVLPLKINESDDIV